MASGTRPSRRPLAAPSIAPMIPMSPQAPICHGVHGPWLKTKFELNAAIAPTAKPGAPPSAKPLRSTMSVIGLTLGSGANAMRPSAARAASVATSASTFDDGCARSYQPKPAASATARTAKAPSCQVTEGSPPRGIQPRGPSPTSGLRPAEVGHALSNPLRPRLRRQLAHDPGGLRGEVPPAGEDLLDRTV